MVGGAGGNPAYTIMKTMVFSLAMALLLMVQTVETLFLVLLQPQLAAKVERRATATEVSVDMAVRAVAQVVMLGVLMFILGGLGGQDGSNGTNALGTYGGIGARNDNERIWFS